MGGRESQFYDSNEEVFTREVCLKKINANLMQLFTKLWQCVKWHSEDVKVF